MRRLLPASVLVALAVVVGVVTGGCAAVNPPALTVGTWSLSRDELLQTLDEIEALQQTSQASSSTTSATVQPSFAAQILDFYAQYQLVVQELARRQQVITEADRDASYELLAATLNASQSGQSAQQATGAQVRQQGDKLFGPVLTQVVDQQAGLVAMARAQGSSEAALQEAYDASKAPVTCVSAIVVTGLPSAAAGTSGTTTTLSADAVKNKAEDLKDQLDEGADFATLAKANSALSTAAQGGEMGCLPAGGLPSELETAVAALSEGGVTEPIEVALQGGAPDGWALVKLTRRYTPTLDEVRATLEPTVLKQRINTLKAELVKGDFQEIAVSVDPLFGVWNDTASRVQPPPGAAVPSTTTTLPAGLAGLGGLSGLGAGAAGPGG